MIVNDAFGAVHPIVAGLDVHKMQITATVRRVRPDAAPEAETRAFSALPSGLSDLVAWLQQAGVQTALMESAGIYWLKPFEALEAAHLRPQLVHVQKVKQIKGHKTDVADSRWLARVCQYGLATPSYVPPADFRELRQISRNRRKTIQVRSSCQNRIHKVLDRNGIPLGGILSDIFGLNGRRVLNGLREGHATHTILASLTHHVRNKVPLLADALDAPLNAVDRWLLGDMLDQYDHLTRSIQANAALMRSKLTAYERQLDLLETIPGINEQSAMELWIEIGPDLSVFPKAMHLAAWAGICPGNNESAGKRRSSRTRQGTKHVRTILTECAHAAARTKDCQFQGHHRILASRRGKKRAILATANKMVSVLYAVLRDDKPYQDPAIDYDQLVVKRNASRWLRKLATFRYVIEDDRFATIAANAGNGRANGPDHPGVSRNLRKQPCKWQYHFRMYIANGRRGSGLYP